MTTSAQPPPNGWMYVARDYEPPNTRPKSQGFPKDCFTIYLRPSPGHPPLVWLHVDVVVGTMEPTWDRQSDLLQEFSECDYGLAIPYRLLVRIFLELELRVEPGP